MSGGPDELSRSRSVHCKDHKVRSAGRQQAGSKTIDDGAVVR